MIKIEINKKRYWDVAQVTDMVELYPGRKRMIQSMKDLGPIVEAAGDPLLNENIKFSKDLAVFFPRFQKLFQGFRTPIRGFDIKFNETKIPSLLKGGYYIDINCFYDYNSNRLYAMPLSFLPELARRNKKLHDIIVKCIKLLKWKEVPVIEHPFYDEDDGMIENLVEYISSGDVSYNRTKEEVEIDRELASRELDLYTKYKNRYVNKVFSGFSSLKTVQSLVNKYKPENHIESELIKWCKMVIDAAKEPQDLESFNVYAAEKFCNDQEIEMEDIYNDGNPVEIRQVMRFTWFGNWGYTDSETQYLGEQDGNFGSLEFSSMYECHSKEDIDAARAKFLKEWGLFPEKLSKLLEFGANLIPELWDYIDGKLTAILDDNV